MGDEEGEVAVNRAMDNVCPCVVLVGRGLPLPERLLKGLETRGAQVMIVTDPASVMAELAAGAKAVVVNEPKRVRRLPELLAAMRQYYPRAVCWQFTATGPRGEPTLERMDALSSATPAGDNPLDIAAASVVAEGREAAAAATAKPNGNNGGTAATAAPVSPAPAMGTPPLISSEEMSMLLAPLPGRPERAEPGAKPARGSEGKP